jgi:transposase
MIGLPSGVRVWIAAGHADMRRGMQSLALQVQEVLKRDPHAADLYVFRGRSGSLIKILCMMGLACRSTPSGWNAAGSFGRRRPRTLFSISMAQLAYMLDGIDWRNPQHTWRPTAAG